MTSRSNPSFHLDSPGQSMSWKELVFLMFCTFSVVYRAVQRIVNPKWSSVTWTSQKQVAAVSFLVKKRLLTFVEESCHYKMLSAGDQMGMPSQMKDFLNDAFGPGTWGEPVYERWSCGNIIH